jgi:hypothetical protein
VKSASKLGHHVPLTALRLRREVEQQIANLIDALGAGVLRNSPALVQLLQTVEAELERLIINYRFLPWAEECAAAARS